MPSSNVFLHEQQILQEHGLATINCIRSGMRILGNNTPKDDTYYRVGKGLHAFHIYATEYWTEYLLSHAMTRNKSNADTKSILIPVACQLADELEEWCRQSSIKPQSGITLNDKRLESLQEYTVLHKCVSGALEARSLINMKSRIIPTLGEFPIMVTRSSKQN